MKNIQAQLKILDNYVKEYSMSVDTKIPENSNLNIEGGLGFRIINITKNDDENYIGEIELINKIEIYLEKEKVGKIDIIIGAIFECSKDMKETEVKNMLKFNAAPTLYSIMRAYINANTSLSNMPTINIPMINFVEFFKNSTIRENKEID